MRYADYVQALTLAIREAARRASRDGTTGMSTANLLMVTRFPTGAANANMARRAFADALEQVRSVLGITIY